MRIYRPGKSHKCSGLNRYPLSELDFAATRRQTQLAQRLIFAQSRPSAQSVRPLHARSGCCGPLGAIVNQGRHIPQNIDWRHFRRNAAARSFIPVAELSEPGIIDFVSPRIADTLRPTAKRYSSPAWVRFCLLYFGTRECLAPAESDWRIANTHQ